MTQEQKDLLLKDLCSRLFYGVKVQLSYSSYSPSQIPLKLLSINTNGVAWVTGDKGYPFEVDWSNCKPYLFPMSSMTEEQWIDTPYANLNKFTFDSFKCGCSTLAFETYEVNLSYVVEFIDWCYKNHFDIHGLIPMGLAIDATNKDIY
jgi:hypothetical protein